MNGKMVLWRGLVLAGAAMLAGVSAAGPQAQTQTQAQEVLAMDLRGGAYVKRPGRRFSEGVRIGQRYASGSQLSVEAGSTLTLLLPDDRVLVVPAGGAWVVGQPLGTLRAMESPRVAGFSLWNSLVGKSQAAQQGAAQSSIVGAVRAGGDGSPLVDRGGPEEQSSALAEAQAYADAFSGSAPALAKRLQALFLENRGFLASAEQAYLQALANASGREERDAALQCYIDMLNANQRYARAEQVKKDHGAPLP